MRCKAKWTIVVVVVLAVLGTVFALRTPGPKSPYDRALAYDRIGKPDSAIQEYDGVITLKPDWGMGYYKRGRAYARKADHARAIQDFNKAIELEPSMAPAYYHRALAYDSVKNYDKAWADVATCQKLGRIVDSEFLNKLKKDSGRNE